MAPSRGREGRSGGPAAGAVTLVLAAAVFVRMAVSLNPYSGTSDSPQLPCKHTRLSVLSCTCMYESTMSTMYCTAMEKVLGGISWIIYDRIAMDEVLWRRCWGVYY